MSCTDCLRTQFVVKWFTEITQRFKVMNLITILKQTSTRATVISNAAGQAQFNFGDNASSVTAMGVDLF